jgi:hypothetical protein
LTGYASTSIKGVTGYARVAGYVEEVPMYGPQLLGRELAKMRADSLRGDGGSRGAGRRARLGRLFGRSADRKDRRPLPGYVDDARVMRIGDCG